MFHEGDISYARGSVSQWDQYFEQYEPVFKAAPVMTCVPAPRGPKKFTS